MTRWLGQRRHSSEGGDIQMEIETEKHQELEEEGLLEEETHIY